MSTKNKNVKYAEKDVLDENEFNSKNIKQRITIMIDQDVLDAFKKKAVRERSKYQTLINQVLRGAISEGEENHGMEKRLRKLERLILKNN